MRSLHSLSLVLAAAALLPLSGVAQEKSQKVTPPPSTETPAQRDARMDWWRKARFGMFIHYGIYSALEGEWNGKSIGGGGVEWHQTRTGLDSKTYSKAALLRFHPKKDAAQEWADIAKVAGCQYVVLTSKHHDGFALFDSKLTDFDTQDTIGRDLCREYVDAVRGAGMRVGFYHSVIDWHHPQYDFRIARQLPYPAGEKKAAGDAPRDHNKYIEFLHGQSTELVTNYGPIDILWWDYSSQQFDGEEAWKAIGLMAKMREKQPGIIMNNRLYRRPEAGWKSMGTSGFTLSIDPRYGDFVTPEQHIPANGMPGVDWEVCMTMNGTWGWSKYDKKWKSTQDLVQKLCDIAGKGGNFLLNIGPMPDGSVPPESIQRMKEIGGWMKVNGEAIYGTEASPLLEIPSWGRVTRKGSTLYLHVFKMPAEKKITLALANTQGSAKALSDGKTLEVKKIDAGLSIATPAATEDGLPVVIALELSDAPVPIAQVEKVK